MNTPQAEAEEQTGTEEEDEEQVRRDAYKREKDTVVLLPNQFERISSKGNHLRSGIAFFW
jgi:hypothetical protein